MSENLCLKINLNLTFNNFQWGTGLLIHRKKYATVTYLATTEPMNAVAYCYVKPGGPQ